jgi:hypothetical protein
MKVDTALEILKSPMDHSADQIDMAMDRMYHLVGRKVMLEEAVRDALDLMDMGEYDDAARILEKVKA